MVAVVVEDAALNLARVWTEGTKAVKPKTWAERPEVSKAKVRAYMARALDAET